MSYILGIHGGLVGHDANICLLDMDSNKYLHIEEERLSRRKHGPSSEKINECITFGNNFVSFIENKLDICWNEIKFIVYGRDLCCHPNRNIDRNYRPDQKFDSPFKQEIKLHYPMYENIDIKEINKKMFLFDTYRTNSNSLRKDIFFLNHHIAHGAYSYFTSPFDKSIIFSYDGVGYEESYAMSMIGDKILSNFRDYSKLYIGFWYHFLTNAIFKSMDEKCLPSFWEGKTMALSSYGQPIYLNNIKNKLYLEGDPFRSFDEDKIKIAINRSFNSVSDFQTLKDYHISILGINPKEKNKFDFLANLACSWQTYIEELIVECMIMLRDHYNISNLCICGGCGLNGMVNYKLQKYFDEVYIPPATSDCGISIGCALYGKHIILGKEKIDYGNIAFTGMEYDIDKSLFEKYVLKSKKLSYSDLYKIIAKEIYDGKIIGWYQGRSESGPRALGNRSILADPSKEYMKDKLNDKVKHREWFRPFAPSIMKEFVNEYFYDVVDEKYMLKIAKVREHKLNSIQSAVHVDGTGRVQTVSKDDNEHFYNLIKEFYNISGIPVLLNTSFNLNGEPIVETPEDAIKSFLSTEIDILVLKDYIITK